MNLKSRVNQDGLVRIWDIPAKKWRSVPAVDAREMLERKTGSWEAADGSTDEEEAEEARTSDELRELPFNKKLALAAEHRISGASTMDEEKLIELLCKKAGYEYKPKAKVA